MCARFYLHGVIVGDVAGSKYERHGTNIYIRDFPFPDETSFITDDTIMTLAVAETIMQADAEPQAVSRIAP